LTTNYSYDALSRLISQSDPFTPGHTTEFTYLPEGQQKDRRDLAGGNLKREVTRTYNADYTLRKEQATDSGEVLTLCNYDAGQGASSGYDANGNLLTSRTVTGSNCDTGPTVASRQMTYDHADRLTELVQSVAPQGQAEVKRTQRFSYRKDGVLTESTWIDGGPASGATARTTTYEHSDGALLESVTDWRASSSSVSTFDHLPSGALTEADLGSGVATGAFSYHPDGSARSLTWDATGHASPVRAHTQIAYDLGGLRTSEQVATVRSAGDVTGDTGGKAAFSYDLADRLKSWESPFRASPDAASDQPETTYTLDDGGNVVAESTTSQSGSGTTTEDASATYVNGRLQDRSVTTYEPSTGAQQHTTALDFDYTGLGEESERSATTSFAGTSLVVAETRNSSYDPAGYSDVHDHNKTVNGTPVAGEPDLDYLYSASGQVIARKQTSASATSWRYFFYFAGTTSLAEETSEQGATYARYLLASGQAIAEQTYTEDATTTEPGATPTFTFLLTDPDGNVATELESDGTVAAQRAYDPYGAPDEGGTSEETGDEPSTLGFQGSHTDRATGSILLGPRIYDPSTERFTSADFFVSSGADLSLGTDPLTGNRYLFAAANPVAFFDDGHAPHYGGGSGRWKRTCDGWDKACGQRRTGSPYPSVEVARRANSLQNKAQCESCRATQPRSPASANRTDDDRGIAAWINKRFWDPLGWGLGRLATATGGEGRPCGENARCIEGGLFLKLLPRDAMTMGHTVVAKAALTPELQSHELGHVGDFEKYGMTFVPRYVGGYAAAWMRTCHRGLGVGGCVDAAYYGNTYEERHSGR
jgi:RHS repeat-associated protein